MRYHCEKYSVSKSLFSGAKLRLFEILMPVRTNDSDSIIKVVIAMDHPLIALGLTAAIAQSSDVQVVSSVNGTKALPECLRAAQADVLLLDEALLGCDGWEAIGEISRDFPNFAIVLMTDGKSHVDLIAALRHGVRACCPKDLAPSRLMAAIHIVYDGDVWLDGDMALALASALPGAANGKSAGNASENGWDRLSVYSKLMPGEEHSFERSRVTGAVSEVQSVRGHLQALGTESGIAGSTSSAGKERLTERELIVLQCIAQGMTNLKIAARLSVSVATTKAYVRSIFTKLNVKDRAEEAAEAIRHGLI